MWPEMAIPRMAGHDIDYKSWGYRKYPGYEDMAPGRKRGTGVWQSQARQLDFSKGRGFS
jgi:hypothetical protein